jgi:Uma2 family endonuclease
MGAETTTDTPARAPYRFTVDQYHRLYDAGIIPEGVELLRGIIAVKGHHRNGRPVPFRFDLHEYHRMIELGILTEDDPVELIRGEVVLTMTQGDPHGLAIEALTQLLVPMVGAIPDGWSVRCQLPVVFPDSEPEPDFAVCLSAGRRGHTHPRPEHVAVVIEVAATSLVDDRTVRLALYAEAGILVYWIVNLVDRQVEVYADPVTPPTGDPHYRTRTDYTPGQHVPLTVAGSPIGTVPVDSVLP